MITPAKNVNFRFRCGTMMPRCAACSVATILNMDVEQVPCVTRDYEGEYSDWKLWYKSKGYQLEESDSSGFKLAYQLIKCFAPNKEFYGAHAVVTHNGTVVYNPTNYLTKDVIDIDRDYHFDYKYDNVFHSYIDKVFYYEVKRL